MGKVFSKARGDLLTTIDLVMRRYHSRLSDLGVTVETMVVYGPRNKEGIQTGPALTVRGSEAYACIRVSSLEERVAGRGDAIMKIDGDRLKDMRAETLEALIDHELTHLELVPDPEGGEYFCTDDEGRIRLKLRRHDFEVGWFHEVAARHGSASIEVQQAQSLVQLRQTYFAFLDLPAEPAGDPKPTEQDVLYSDVEPDDSRGTTVAIKGRKPRRKSSAKQNKAAMSS